MIMKLLHAGIAAACLIGVFTPTSLAADFKPQVIREYNGDKLVFAVIGGELSWGANYNFGSDPLWRSVCSGHRARPNICICFMVFLENVLLHLHGCQTLYLILNMLYVLSDFPVAQIGVAWVVSAVMAP